MIYFFFMNFIIIDRDKWYTELYQHKGYPLQKIKHAFISFHNNKSCSAKKEVWPVSPLFIFLLKLKSRLIHSLFVLSSLYQKSTKAFWFTEIFFHKMCWKWECVVFVHERKKNININITSVQSLAEIIEISSMENTL